MITIEKDVPMPVGSDGLKYPFARMEVGDSFANKTRCYASAHAYSKKFQPTAKFTEKAEGDGFRIWRIA